MPLRSVRSSDSDATSDAPAGTGGLRRRIVAASVAVLVIGVAVTVLCVDHARVSAREDALASLRAAANERLQVWSTVAELQLLRLQIFADGFAGRANRTHPMDSAMFHALAQSVTRSQGGSEVTATMAVLAYVSRDERAEWEAKANNLQYLAPPAASGDGWRISEANVQDYYFVVALRYNLPTGAANGDVSRDFPFLFVSAEQSMLQRNAVAAPAVPSDSGEVEIPIQLPITSSKPLLRPVDGVLGLTIGVSYFVDALRTNSVSGADVALIHVEDVSIPGEASVVVSDVVADGTERILIAEGETEVATRRWRAQILTTQAAVDKVNGGTGLHTVWIAGLVASTAAAVLLFAAATLLARLHRLQLEAVAFKVTAATHDRVMTAVSHELRNPLTRVWAGVESFLDSYGAEMTSEMRSDLDLVISGARAMQRVLDDLLDSQSMRDKGNEMSQRAARIDVLGRDVGNMMRAYLPGGVALGINMDPGIPHSVLINDLLIRQIISSSLANACKSAAPNSVIELRFSWCSGFLVVQVLNTGLPLPRGSTEKQLLGKHPSSDRRLPPDVLKLINKPFAKDACTRRQYSSDRSGRAFLITDMADRRPSLASPPAKQVSSPLSPQLGSNLSLPLSFASAMSMGGSLGVHNVRLGGVTGGPQRFAVHFWVAVPAERSISSSSEAFSERKVDELRMMSTDMGDHDGSTSGPRSLGRLTRLTTQVVLPPGFVTSAHDLTEDDIEAGFGEMRDGSPSSLMLDGSPSSEMLADAKTASAWDLDQDHVVVVDDEAVIRRIAGRLITKLGGRVCASFEDGFDLPRKLEELDTPPTCVFLDIVMLRSNGIEVLRDLRAMPRWKHLPVFAMTSNVERASIDLYKATGFTGVVGKPFTIGMMRRALEYAHEHAEAPPFLTVTSPAARDSAAWTVA